MPAPDLTVIQNRFLALCQLEFDRRTASGQLKTRADLMGIFDAATAQIRVEFGEDAEMSCWLAIARAVTTTLPRIVPIN